MELDEQQLIDLLNDHVEREGLRSFCRRQGLDPGNVSNVLNLKKPMQKKIASALGFVKTTKYVSL